MSINKLVVALFIFSSTLVYAAREPTRESVILIVVLNAADQAVDGVIHGINSNCNDNQSSKKLCDALSGFKLSDIEKNKLIIELAMVNDKYFDVATLEKVGTFLSTNTGKRMLGYFRNNQLVKLGNTPVKEIIFTDRERKEIAEFMNSSAYKKYNSRHDGFESEKQEVILNIVGESLRNYTNL
ncbi:hypothetical protein CXF83_15810 [Shewanella sp. Choline-02u-19]|uniref:hypothetical protein n=1 Tax=unclassified Shewanella TaxID=196818 RepID=UPI000C336710|nr:MULTISPECIES: hypothetical protein [unclassified Shewanella]PKH53647.1 hypothetical protein CXF84_21660 [Shewanella sp. Bg11-22]PKI28075.1 hypothetical protein CXF83_15810 [Shewanella sp. Choline-02u-19]